MPHTGLAIIEARWSDYGNNSVRPLFETLAGILDGNPHSVRYDMFVEEASLSQIISDIANKRNFHSLYIGAHGDENSFYGLGDVKIGRAKFRNILKSYNTRRSIKGVYFGACSIVTEQNAAFWLTELPSTGLQWIAGYEKEVLWIDSSAVDMIFWSKYLYRRQNTIRINNKAEIEILIEVSNEIQELMPTVFEKMGFNIYYVKSANFHKVW
jgi:hypothetical protein